MPVPNQRLGEYVLIDQIGQGAFGEVWRARHHAWADQIVAIKIPADPQYVRNLQREGHAVHRLSHPNIVKAIAFDPFSDPPYFTMEYVPGNDLRSLIRRGPMQPAYAVAIIKQVLAALHHAHTHGVIHRDIKPENILIHKAVEKKGFVAGTVKLTDFGLGKAAAQSLNSIAMSQDRQESKQIVGSYQYMAPEQRDGSDVDARADLYSCGVVFFEMLTGHRPSGMELPSDLNPAVPKELDEVFRRAFARLERRFGSAEEFFNTFTIEAKKPAIEPAVAVKFWRLSRIPLYCAIAVPLVIALVALLWWSRPTDWKTVAAKDAQPPPVAPASGNPRSASMQAPASSPYRAAPAIASAENLNKPAAAKSNATSAPDTQHSDPKPPRTSLHGLPLGLPGDAQRIDTSWMNTLTGERYVLHKDHTGELTVTGRRVQTRFTWELEKDTLTFESDGNDWKMVTEFENGRTQPGKATWIANGVKEDGGTIWRLSQLMTLVREKNLIGRWKSLKSEGEYYLLYVDLSGIMHFADGTSAGCAYGFEDNKLTLHSVYAQDGFRMVIDIKDGVDKPCKATWTSGTKTEDRGTVIRDSSIARAPNDPGPVLSPAPPYLKPSARPSADSLLQATLVREIPLQLGPNLSIALADGGKKIVVSGSQKFLVLDSKTNEPIGSTIEFATRSPNVNQRVFTKVNAQGRYLLTLGDEAENLRVFDLTTLAQVGPTIHQLTLSTADISPDGSHVVASVPGVGNNSTEHFKVWNVADGAPAGPEFSGGIRTKSLQYSPDGKWIIVANLSIECDVRTWDAATGKLVGQPIPYGHNTVESAIINPKGDRLAAIGGRGRLIISEPITGKILHEAQADTWCSVLAFSPDGTRIAVGGRANVRPQDPKFTACRVYDVATGEPVTGLLEHETSPGTLGTEHSIVFSDNGKYLLTRSCYGQTARIWDLSKGTLVVQLDHPRHVREAIFSNDGTVLTTCADGVVRIWKLPREVVTN